MNNDIMNLIKNLSISYEIALSIGNSLNLREMIDRVLKTVVRKVEAYRGIVWLWNEDALEYLTSVGFCTKGVNYHAVGDILGYRLKTILDSGRPLVKTEQDDDFKDFCAPFTGNEKEVLLVPIGKTALIQLSFTYEGASGKGLAGILAGVAPKLSNAILSCLNHNKLLAIERAETQNLKMRYQDLVNNLDVGIFISTVDGQLIDVNPTFLKIFGFTNRRELYKLTWPSLFVNAEEKENFMQTITNKGSVKNLEILLRQKSGETFWAQVTAVLSSLQEDKNQNVMGIVEDITDRKTLEERLHYLATHDSLTNIPNRYFLEEALKRATAKARRGEESALLLIDIDNFKIVNDTLGHAAGDELLIDLTKILRTNLREGDLLARLGGDEFIVMLEGVTHEDVWVVAEKLRQAVGESRLNLPIYEQCLNLSISIGIIMVDGTLDYQKLLSRVDAALYTAKDEGRNRVLFVQPEEDVMASPSETNQLITIIKNALKENRLILFFQPVFRLRDRKITHYEVLTRLQGEDGKLVNPDTFIPNAKRFGLIPQIDRWVLQSSLATLKKHPHLRLFVNLSGVSLGDAAMLEFIEKNILEGGIDPSRIGFEITETAFVKNLTQVENWLGRLKHLGIGFALDDFGISFSSFSHLSALPVDYLKIDGSFIRNVDKEPIHRSLVQAINTVAHTLGIKTIAESVENEDILETLCELGIDYGEGCFLGRPIPEGVQLKLL